MRTEQDRIHQSVMTLKIFRIWIYSTNRQIVQEKGELFGKAFEHFIFVEIMAHSSYYDLNYDSNGNFVQFVGDLALVEVRGYHGFTTHLGGN
jgi:hypothetical protein